MVVTAEGDGLDSNGIATISGGTVVVNGPSGDGNGALDVNGTFTVTGGELLASGSAGMAVSPGETSPQGWVSATLASTVQAGTVVQVVDADGAVVATFTAAKALQSVVYSSSASPTARTTPSTPVAPRRAPAPEGSPSRAPSVRRPPPSPSRPVRRPPVVGCAAGGRRGGGGPADPTPQHEGTSAYRYPTRYADVAFVELPRVASARWARGRLALGSGRMPE